MVAKPETLGRFIFNSDYPIDKVVWLYEGVETSPSNPGASKDIVLDVPSMTGTKIPIFVKGAFTVDNWETSSMIGSNVDTVDVNKMVSMYIGWTNYPKSQLEISIWSRNVYSVSKTVKYRLWGVCRDDIRDASDFAKNSTVTKSKLIFNTDNNYPRLYKDGVAKSGDVIEHNLGKIPYVDYWTNDYYSSTPNQNYFTRYWSYSPIGRFGGTSLKMRQTIIATDKTITFTTRTVNGNNGYEDETLWYYYRIYA